MSVFYPLAHTGGSTHLITCEKACRAAISSASNWLTGGELKVSARHNKLVTQHSLILCRASVIFFAKSGETIVRAKEEPQLPDVSTISCCVSLSLPPGGSAYKVLDLEVCAQLVLEALLHGYGMGWLCVHLGVTVCWLCYIVGLSRMDAGGMTA